MARNVALLAFGVVIGIVGGAAVGIHADDEVSAAPDEAFAGADVVADPEPTYGVWDRLAACESTGRWYANTGNGYYGGLQQDLVFWRRHGGLQYASRPDLASRAQQIAVAEVGLSRQGWAAWPSCSRSLGLR